MRIIQGDALETLKTLPDESVQCCLTSPPYWGLRDYGVSGQLGLEKTPEEYIANMVTVFREVRRVLKKDGVCFINIGDSYATSPAGNKSEQKWKNDSYGKSGRYKLDNYRGDLPKDFGLLKPKDAVLIPFRLAIALQADGWWFRQEIIWHKPNPMPESVTDRCTKAHEYIFMLTKNGSKPLVWKARDTGEWSYKPNRKEKFWDEIDKKLKARWVGHAYWSNFEAVREPSTELENINGRRRRNKRQCDKIGDPKLKQNFDRIKEGKKYPTRNLRSVWTIPTQARRDAHFATFPDELAYRCIMIGSKAGDVVLDPFAGSGTVGAIAAANARDAVLIELNPEYVEIINKNLGLFQV